MITASNQQISMPNRQIILIVDDVPINVRILAIALHAEYTVKVAGNGFEALEIARQLPQPDLILLDIMMPEMDGFEVCKRLKADTATRHIPVIFVTAKSEETDETMGLNLGAIDYITKPFSIPITQARIRNHIQHKLAAEQLYASEERLTYALKAGELGAWKLDVKTRTTWRSAIHGRIFGEEPPLPDWNFAAFLEYIHPEDRQEMTHRIEHILSKTTPFHCECRIVRKDGAVRWIWVQGKPELNALDEPAAIYGVVQDITERKHTEEALKIASVIYNTSSEAMLVSDANNHIVAVNPAFTKITGYTPAEVIGKNPNILNSGRHDKNFYHKMWRALEVTGSWHGEIWNRRKDGSLYAEWLSINTIYDAAGAVHQRIALISDITEKKKTDELIWRQANFDPLTNLPNRRSFREKLELALKKSHRDGIPLALFFIDLDNFKAVNDALGHDIGDQLLVDAAHRLVKCVREVDTVARLGGDEFTILLSDVGDSRHVARIAQDIIKRLAEPFGLGGETARISGSIGITFYPTDAHDAETLLQYADQAMYAAKNQGRSRYCYFTESMQEAAQTRLQLINELRDALELQQLEVYFQPINNLSTGRIIKAEALLRWNHPRRGLIAPTEFIPLAEDIGIITQLGDWVFKEAVTMAHEWITRHGGPFQVSVNMSPLQFQLGTDHGHWLDYLRELDMPGECIVIEITEGLLLNNDCNVEKQLDQLRGAGIEIAIDDFGTGYSALSYLKNFNVDYLKIDQSFIRDLCSDPSDLALCDAIIVMARKLGLKVIAEGIETQEQKDLLIHAGCDIGQGYLFAKPMPRKEFEALMSAPSLLNPPEATGC
ncbi:MAG: EAL domain-containing protein [Methylococcaceae bacterium]|nr:MAG: EAL domain-containing protein [Methylococcaceae bacterium]